VQVLFVLAWLTHLVEAIIALRKAFHEGYSRVGQALVFMQTILLGYPSLRLVRSKPSTRPHQKVS
jgi:hypothetical protein